MTKEKAMTKETVYAWEQFAQAGKAAVESMTRFQQIGARSMERMAQHQLAAASDMFELGLRHLEVLTDAKGPEDLWSAQTRFATQVGEKWMANAGKFLDVYLESQSEVGKLFTEHLGSLASRPAAQAAAV
jgi:phasin family protein